MNTIVIHDGFTLQCYVASELKLVQSSKAKETNRGIKEKKGATVTQSYGIRTYIARGFQSVRPSNSPLEDALVNKYRKQT